MKQDLSTNLHDCTGHLSVSLQAMRIFYKKYQDGNLNDSELIGEVEKRLKMALNECKNIKEQLNKIRGDV